MPNNPAQIGSIRVGTGEPLLLIAGPCVIETEALLDRICGALVDITKRLDISLVFKASFDKANRTSSQSFRGPGMSEGLRLLAKARDRFNVPVTTDVHESIQADSVAKTCDLLQVPAFLARQTDLLVAVGSTGRAVNVKKGQFMAPHEMRHVVNKLEQSGCENILLTERGTTFGYGMLVNDFRALPIMRQTGAPVVYDGTHSVQTPASAGDKTGGQREMVPYLVRAAIAVGCDALFLETHPDPNQSPSDGPNMVPLDQMESLLADCVRLRSACPS